LASACSRRSFASSSHLHVKPRVVVIGCGWGGFRFAQDINKNRFDVTLVSPRNHFLFTPLLPSTAVGTLEFRCIQEPVRTITGLSYLQASCDDVDFAAKQLHCTESFKQQPFSLPYDYLVLAPGSETNTFNVPGVIENPSVFFLKQLSEARAIRNRLIEAFERASMPGLPAAEKQRLLTFIVVGGGATNIEFASELHDFLQHDVLRCYSHLSPLVKIVVVEASGHLLGSFKESLVGYVEALFRSRKIDVRLGTTVTAVETQKIEGAEGQGCVAVLGDGKRLPFGLMVWSTGIRQVGLLRKLVKDGQVAHGPGGRVLLDKQLRLLTPPDSKEGGERALQGGAERRLVAGGSVFAMGDCGADELHPLPALAQVASQQGKYLANLMNSHHAHFPPQPAAPPSLATLPAFQYSHLGTMASVGEWKGVIDTQNISESAQRPQLSPAISPPPQNTAASCN